MATLLYNSCKNYQTVMTIRGWSSLNQLKEYLKDDIQIFQEVQFTLEKMNNKYELFYQNFGKKKKKQIIINKGKGKEKEVENENENENENEFEYQNQNENQNQTQTQIQTQTQTIIDNKNNKTIINKKEIKKKNSQTNSPNIPKLYLTNSGNRTININFHYRNK